MGFVVILHRNTKCDRRSSSGKLEFTSYRHTVKGDFLGGSRLIKTHPSSFGEQWSAMRRNTDNKMKRAGELKRGKIMAVWFSLLSSDAIQKSSSDISCLAVTHRGTSKDSHDPQSASLWWEEWIQAWRTQSLSPSIPPSIHPSVCKLCHDDRWQSWETSFCCCQMCPVNELVRNEWHMLHFKTSRSGPQSCISERPAHTVSYTQCMAALWWWVMQKRMYTLGFRSGFRTWERKDALYFFIFTERKILHHMFIVMPLCGRTVWPSLVSQFSHTVVKPIRTVEIFILTKEQELVFLWRGRDKCME